MITDDQFSFTEFTLIGTCVAFDPKKEQPGGLAINFWSSTTGLPSGSRVLDTVWFTLAISLANLLRLCRLSEGLGIEFEPLSEESVPKG